MLTCQPNPLATLQVEGFPIVSAHKHAWHLSTEMMIDEGWQHTRTLLLQPVVLKQTVHHPPLGINWEK